MRLAITVDPLCSRMGGIGRYTWELVKGLRQHPDIDHLHYYLNGRWIADVDAMIHDEPVFETSSGWLGRKLAPWREQRRIHGTLFHGTNFFLPAEAKRGVITVHDLSVLRFPELHPIERVRDYERHFARSLSVAGHVITPSETIRREVIDDLGVVPGKVTAIALAASPDYRPREAADVAPVLSKHGLTYGEYCLSVATIEPRKKLKETLAAWEDLPASLRRRYPLVIVGGTGWANDSIRAKIEAGERAGWVRNLGFFPEEELPHLYSGARVLLYPSTYEGFGLPAVEAMAAGIPCIVSGKSCLVEVTKGAAMESDPDDTPAYREAIVRALSDDAWRQRAITASLAVASGYSWRRCVEETVAVYRKVEVSA